MVPIPLASHTFTRRARTRPGICSAPALTPRRSRSRRGQVSPCRSLARFRDTQTLPSAGSVHSPAKAFGVEESDMRCTSGWQLAGAEVEGRQVAPQRLGIAARPVADRQHYPTVKVDFQVDNVPA